MLFMAVASLIRMVFVTINLCAASLAASSRCSPALARLCQGERLSELSTSRTLGVFDSKGDGPAKDRERFGHVRDRPSCVGRKAPLAQRCIFGKQYRSRLVSSGLHSEAATARDQSNGPPIRPVWLAIKASP